VVEAGHRTRRKSYGWTANVYSAAERAVFGSQLMRARLAWLHTLYGANTILILGEGDGRFLNALVQQNPNATIVVVDRSQRMLARAQRRLAGSANTVHFVQQDAANFLTALEGSRHFDAIVTQFVLDCLPPAEVASLVRLATQRLAKGGTWLWADFFIPKSGPLRTIARIMLTILYWFFRATTDTSAQFLVDPTAHFYAHGLRLKGSSSALCGMVKAHYMVLDTDAPP
jgi:ubiquinone/menaquinone biosynthesis C-methylase UbiE